MRTERIVTNPYQPPREFTDQEASAPDERDTLLPDELVSRTAWHLKAFGVFQFIQQFIPLLFSAGLTIDVFAIAIASIGMDLNKRSFRRFPWTSVLCGIYALVFGLGFLTLLWNGGPWPITWTILFLGVLFAECTWACFLIYLIFRCYFWHRNSI
ncbi:hypothetical protein CA13_45230 [Planctomycetes bacterium CA13]|uniref:Uncharacterized protein n=1 Tax=Novipirellula herctigrandis TaxID=2527986 RepID=A0A5C5Z790_9BACT|nr:hypothetical protein CA13_45230 [Planctomycetes bacterium CA13]